MVISAAIGARYYDAPDGTRLGTLSGPLTLPVVGRNAEGTWALVALEDQQVWIKVSDTLNPISGDFSSVPIVPVTGSSTPIPTQAVPPTGTPAPTTPAVLRQWASRAEASSQYSASDWSAQQATGAPDTRTCGDIATAWASRTATGVDTLTLYFAQPVLPTQVNIYQTWNPGAITAVALITEAGTEIQLADSADPGTACPGVFSLPVVLANPVPVIGVRLYLDQRRTRNWNEIDAVQLVGTQP